MPSSIIENWCSAALVWCKHVLKCWVSVLPHLCCCMFLQDYPQRQWLFPLPSHGGDSEWNHVGVWRKHTQWHVHEPRSQVFLLGLLGLQFGSVRTQTHVNFQPQPCWLCFAVYFMGVKADIWVKCKYFFLLLDQTKENVIIKLLFLFYSGITCSLMFFKTWWRNEQITAAGF